MLIRCVVCGEGQYPRGFTKVATNFIKLAPNQYAHANRRVCMAFKCVIMGLEDRPWQDAQSVKTAFIERLSTQSLAASAAPPESSGS